MSTPYYDDGQCVIYHGDCLEVLPELGLFDLVVTSPPYNLGVSPGGGFGHYSDDAGMRARGGAGMWPDCALANGYVDHDDAMPPEAYERWQRACLHAMWEHLTDDGAIFYNHKPRVQARGLWMPTAIGADLPLRQIITWARGGGVNFAPTHFLPTYEWLLVYAKPNWRLRSKQASVAGDVWRISQEASTEHPAPFPLGIPTLAIDSTTAATVLDPFMGSGTTLRAAKDLGRKAVGIELSERYCEMAARRLGQEVLPL